PEEGEEILVGHQAELAQDLIPILNNYIHKPSLMLDLVEFCKATDRISEARKAAFRQLEELFDQEAARSWRDTQVMLPLIRRQLKSVVRAKHGPAQQILAVDRIRIGSKDLSGMTVQVPTTLSELMDDFR